MIMKFNGFYLFVAFAGAALLLITSEFFNSSVNGVPAVTTSRELVVRSAVQTEVLDVRVRPGQEVRAKDTLVVLRSLELEQERARLTRKLSSLETEQKARESAFRSSLDLARNDINLEIRQLLESVNQAEQELALNLRLVQRSDASAAESPLSVRIRDLRIQIDLYRERLRQRESGLQSAYRAEQAILQNQIDLTRIELDGVERTGSGLVRISDYDGVVESVAVRPGMMLDAFASLVTVRPSSPTIAVAYVQSGMVGFPLGTEVELMAFDGDAGRSQGKVIGFGSIVELPEILQKSTAVKAFGKEVFVEIPVANPFSTGQKVLVKPLGE